MSRPFSQIQAFPFYPKYNSTSYAFSPISRCNILDFSPFQYYPKTIKICQKTPVFQQISPLHYDIFKALAISMILCNSTKFLSLPSFIKYTFVFLEVSAVADKKYLYHKLYISLNVLKFLKFMPLLEMLPNARKCAVLYGFAGFGFSKVKIRTECLTFCSLFNGLRIPTVLHSSNRDHEYLITIVCHSPFPFLILFLTFFTSFSKTRFAFSDYHHLSF